jgi:hypothetical protein
VIFPFVLTIDRQGLTGAGHGVHTAVEPEQRPCLAEEQVGQLRGRRVELFEQRAGTGQARPGVPAAVEVIVQLGERSQAARVGDGVRRDGRLVDRARLLEEWQCLLVATELGVEPAELDQTAGILGLILPWREGATGERLQVERLSRVEAAQVAVQIGHDQGGVGECRVVGPRLEDG